MCKIEFYSNGLPPIDLFIVAEARKATYNLSGTGVSRDSYIGLKELQKKIVK